MARILYVHPENPQQRLIKLAAQAIRDGDIIVYPSDSGYALAWSMDNTQAPKKVGQIKHTDEHSPYSIICQNISQITTFALLDNVAFRLIKEHVPGPYTFILPATRRVPKKLQHQKRKSIGIRLPVHRVVDALLEALDEPFMSSSLVLPDEEMYELDSQDIDDRIGHSVTYIIDSGYNPIEPSTVVELLEDGPKVIRAGQGVIDFV